jgi:hypothetical protein
MKQKQFKPSQTFLLELIHIYREIDSELQLIVGARESHDWVSDISNVILALSVRLHDVRRDNEISLFRETLQLVKGYRTKKLKVKAPDIAMKYSIVCQVLSNRLKEHFELPRELIAETVQKIAVSK